MGVSKPDFREGQVGFPQGLRVIFKFVPETYWHPPYYLVLKYPLSSKNIAKTLKTMLCKKILFIPLKFHLSPAKLLSKVVNFNIALYLEIIEVWLPKISF